MRWLEQRPYRPWRARWVERSEHSIEGVSGKVGPGDNPCLRAEVERVGLSYHPVGADRARDHDDKMPGRAAGQGASVGRELGADRSPVLGGLVDLEREDGGPSLGRDESDAVGADEAAEDLGAHRVGQPELQGRVLAIARPIEGGDRVDGVEHVAQVCRGRWRESSTKPLVTERAYAVGEFGSTGRRIRDRRALEEPCAVEAA